MKKILICIFALVSMTILNSFTNQESSDTIRTRFNNRFVTFSDSGNRITISTEFEPAKLIVNDSRTAIDATSIIEKNTESNLQVAEVIERAATVLGEDLRERRCQSSMDRITTRTGKTIQEIESVIHKKKVFDMIFYTIFLLTLIYFWYGITQFTYFSKSMLIKEFWIRIISYTLLFILLYLCYTFLDKMWNHNYYPEIDTILKASFG